MICYNLAMEPRVSSYWIVHLLFVALLHTALTCDIVDVAKGRGQYATQFPGVHPYAVDAQWTADKALDGNISPDIYDDHCAAPYDVNRSSVWWMVDLGAQHAIYNVTIYSSTANKFFLGYISVRVSDSANISDHTESDQCAYYDHREFPEASAETLVCSQVKYGRYVSIQRTGRNVVFYMTICELLVMGRPIQNTNCGRCADVSCNTSQPCVQCEAGWQAPDCTCDIDECPLDDCEQICRNSEGSYQCDCRSGFSLDDDRRHCTDIDECETDDNDCTGLLQCINTIGNFQCVCPSGYTQDGMSCDDIDECETGDNDCTGLLQCTNTIGNFQCVCPSGYTQDGMSCDDIDECSLETDDCSQDCENSPGAYLCTCKVGSVLDETDGKTCQCPPGYNASSSDADADDDDGAAAADADDDDDDDLTCVDIDECETDNGGCEHTCDNTDGSFVCSCDEGYKLLADDKLCKSTSSSDGDGADSMVISGASAAALLVILLMK